MRRIHLPRQWRGILPILCFVALWEFIARLDIFPPVLFPSFLTVLKRIAELTLQGKLLTDITTSSFRAVVGLVLAIVTGVTVGISMARIQLVNWFFEPLIAVGFPMPTITLIPVFILWFGIGH